MYYIKWINSLLRLICRPVSDDGVWRTRYNSEIYTLNDEQDVVKVVKTGRFEGAGTRLWNARTGFLTLLKLEGTQENLSWGGLSQLRKIWRMWAWGTGDVSHEIETSGGRFWKRLRFTKNCDARRRKSLDVSVTMQQWQITPKHVSGT